MIKAKKFVKFAFGAALLGFLYGIFGCSYPDDSSESKKRDEERGQAKIESVDIPKYEVSTKQSTSNQSNAQEDDQSNAQEDVYANQIISEETTRTGGLENYVNEEYTEEKSPLEEATDRHFSTERHFFGQGTVLRIEVFEKDSKYPVDARIRLLDRNGESIRYQQGREIKFPYEENTKDGVISFNIPPEDLSYIDSIEVTAYNFKAIQSKLPLKTLLRYNSASIDKLPDEVRNQLGFEYFQDQSEGIAVDFKDQKDFFEKIEKKRYQSQDFVYSQQGLFHIIPIRISLESLGEKIRIE